MNSELNSGTGTVDATFEIEPLPVLPDVSVQDPRIALAAI